MSVRPNEMNENQNNENVKVEKVLNENNVSSVPQTGIIIHDLFSKENSIFLGDNISDYNNSELEICKYENLLIPNNPEYYDVSFREIIDAEDLNEILITFKDNNVAVQYKDMILNGVHTISIMPAIDDQEAFVEFSDIEETTLGILVPESDMYCLFVSNVQDDDVVLYVTIDLISYNSPGNKYPHFIVDCDADERGYMYHLKAKLNPKMINPVYIASSYGQLTDLGRLADMLDESELSFLPHTGVIVDNEFKCYTNIRMNEHYNFSFRLCDDNSNDEDKLCVMRKYTDFLKQSNMNYKAYINQDSIVLQVDSNGDDGCIFRVVNYGCYKDECGNRLVATLYRKYADILKSIESGDGVNAFNDFLKEANASDCIIVDSVNKAIYTLEADRNYQDMIV